MGAHIPFLPFVPFGLQSQRAKDAVFQHTLQNNQLHVSLGKCLLFIAENVIKHDFTVFTVSK